MFGVKNDRRSLQLAAHSVLFLRRIEEAPKSPIFGQIYPQIIETRIVTVLLPSSFVTPFLKRTHESDITNSYEPTAKTIVTENVVNEEFCEFFPRQCFLTSHKVHHFSELIDKDIDMVIAPDRFRKLDNKVEGLYVTRLLWN